MTLGSGVAQRESFPGAEAPRSRRVLVAIASVLGLGVLVVASVYWAIWAFNDHEDQRGVDLVEATFFDNREGFEEQASLIAELARSEPDVIATRWSSQVCSVGDDGDETCRDTTPQEDAVSDATPGTRVTVWQAKDDGRVFFRFVERPCYLMFDPDQRDAEDFAKEHGFEWGRDLRDGWSIPCYIEDDDMRREMWVHEVF